MLLADLLAQIDFAFQALRGEGGDVQAVVVEDGVEELEAVVVEELGDLVTDQAALLETSDVGLEGQGLIAAGDIEAGDIEFDAGTDAGGSGGSVGAGGQAGFEFQAEAVGEGVALGFLHLDENIFLRIGALGILDGGIDLAEDAEIVELALRVEEVLLAERLAGNFLNFALHDVVAGVIESGDHHLVDEELFAFLDGVVNVFAIGLAG